MSRSVHLHGRNWTTPRTSTAWQRERAQAPLTPVGAEFTGRYKVITWTVTIVVGIILWAAFFCWVLG